MRFLKLHGSCNSGLSEWCHTQFDSMRGESPLRLHRTAGSARYSRNDNCVWEVEIGQIQSGNVCSPDDTVEALALASDHGWL